jgi:hypothetical protein
MQKSLTIATLFLTALLAAGCEQEGPAERAGEKLDDAATDVGNAIEDACEDVKEGAGADDKDC